MIGSLTAKDAALTLKLKADSGYTCEQKARVSAYQWGDILAICEGSERGVRIAAADDLLEALKGSVIALSDAILRTRSIEDAENWTLVRDAARAALAKATGGDQ